ncbi:hypothetical protein [Flavobacterium polysaccharolyticum]
MIIVGCNDRSHFVQKLSIIRYSDIQSVEIRKQLYDSFCVILDSVQIRKTVALINSNQKTELLKAGPKFWLIVKLKNNSIVKYKIIDTKIGENDLYKEMNDKEFFKAIYYGNKKSKSQVIEKKTYDN